MLEPFLFIEGSAPILFSFPHVGTFLPTELASKMDPYLYKTTPDTDWYVDKIYNFTKQLDCSTIVALYSRYYIDLNRDPSQKKLYNDSRQETALVPLFSFDQKKLYLDEFPDAEEIQKRIDVVYRPYHQQIDIQLNRLKAMHPQILMIDAHSINRHVPSIQQNPFPDIILGTVDGTSCSPFIQECTWNVLKKSPYECSLNTPFKGGYITRSFHNKSNNINTLQIEMSQDIYLNTETMQVDPNKALKLTHLLQNLTSELLKIL